MVTVRYIVTSDDEDLDDMDESSVLHVSGDVQRNSFYLNHLACLAAQKQWSDRGGNEWMSCDVFFVRIFFDDKAVYTASCEAVPRVNFLMNELDDKI